MFDPLDLFTPQEEQLDRGDVISSLEPKVTEKPADGNCIDIIPLQENECAPNEGIVGVLDFPLVPYASPKVILCILMLMRPNTQVNFSNDVNLAVKIKDDIPLTLLDELVNWYTEVFPNPSLNTIDKVIEKISMVKTLSDKELLLNYYTSVLKNFEKRLMNSSEDIETINLVIQEVISRISENCGRTAQPSMTREFQMDNLSHIIKLFEPSLTADNLGWKTWGSSLVLSQFLVKSFNELITLGDYRSKKVRVLELGSGTGLVGIAWGCKWKEETFKQSNYNLKNMELFLTDLPEITDNLDKNVKNNDISEFCKVDVLDWTDPTSFTDKHSAKPFQYILIADPIYSPEHPKWVVEMIVKFLDKPTEESVSKCFIQIPIRDKYQSERETLWRLIDENNLKIINEHVEYGQDDWGQVKYLFKELQWK